MEPVESNECALWVACQHIAEHHQACPSDVLGTKCPGLIDGAGSEYGIECDNYTRCWIAYFKKLVS